MSLFEFILVMVSLILAIGVTRLLQGIVEIVRCRETLELDWIPLAWAANLFMLVTAHWWSLWDLRGVAWTFPAFFFILLPPTLIYIAVSLLVSGDVSQPGASMVTKFERVRVPFMGVMLVLYLLVSFDGWALGTELIWNSLRLIQLGIIGSAFVGIFFSNRLVQSFLAAFVLTIMLFVAFVLRFLPGAFGPS